MPRLPPSLLWRANRINPHLPRLLRECRDLESAQNELRWMREHVESLENSAGQKQGGASATSLDRWSAEVRLRKMVNERSRGKPLQYILGDQPFGNLDILCRPGVLIPRDDTEPYTTRTARWIMTNVLKKNEEKDDVFLEGTNQILRGEQPLRILDLCTGTGCISLHLHSLLAPHFPNIQIVGVDISTQALDLARENLAHNIAKGNLDPRASDEVHFVQADILKEPGLEADIIPSPSPSGIGIDIPDLNSALSNYVSDGRWDVIISNPPYISLESYNNGTTKRSVRLYEPKLALVPPPVIKPPDYATRSPQKELENGDPSILDANFTENPAHIRSDLFYPRLIDLAVRYRAFLTVAECGDLDQAVRVRNLMRRCGRTCENVDRKSYRTTATEWLFYEPEDDVHVPLPPLLEFCEKLEREVDYGAWKGSAAVVMTRERKRA